MPVSLTMEQLAFYSNKDAILIRFRAKSPLDRKGKNETFA
jgi:hypothetical protein